MKHFFTFLLILVFTSCSGLLWDARSEGDLTLSISNPFSQPGHSASNRALAAEGKYMYIELALISDQVAFDKDETKVATGNGTWNDTGWGGHAVLTLDLYDLTSQPEDIPATFSGVPRGRSLKARVFLDSNEAYVTAGIKAGGPGAYGPLNEFFPICQTYNPDMTEYGDIQWITISSEDLMSNQIKLPIRPYNPDPGSWPSMVTYETAVTPQNIPVAGQVMQTNFVAFRPDLASSGYDIKDVAFFVASWGSIPTESSPPPITGFLYDETGLPVSEGTVSVKTIEPNPPEYRFVQIGVKNLQDIKTPPLILGCTRVSEPVSSWEMSYGVLYSSSFYISTGSVSWDTFPEILSTHLDFRVIQFSSSLLTSTDLQSISQINALEIAHDSGWIAGTATANTYTGDITALDGRFVVILARPTGAPDTEQFIFAKNKNI